MATPPRGKFREEWVARASLAVNTVIMVATLVLTFVAVREILPELSRIAETTEAAALQRKMAIITPPNQAVVPSTAFTSGFSPFTDRPTYLLVVSGDGRKWIQGGGPLAVGPNGYWSATVRFGEAQAGCGELFQLLLLAPREALDIEKFRDSPRDAILSRPVTVVRAPCPETR